MEPSPHEGQKNLGLDRLIFFSDGVFAIAITLLVLDIQLPANLPQGDFPQALFDLQPEVEAYALSFFVIGAYWIAHHRFYQLIIRYDNRLLWLNLLLLLFVAFIPFPTRAVAEYGTDNIPSIEILYAATIALTGLTMELNWWYAAAGHRLIAPDLDPAYIRNIHLRGLVFPIVFLLSIVVSFISVQAAPYFWYLAAVLSLVTSARLLPQSRHQGPN